MSPHHLLVQTPHPTKSFVRSLPSELVCLPKLFYATGDLCTFPDLPKPAMSTTALLSMGLPGLNPPPTVTTANFFTPSFLFFNHEKYPREEFPFWPITTSFFIPP